MTPFLHAECWPCRRQPSALEDLPHQADPDLGSAVHWHGGIRDHTIVDDGDGTITISASGGARYDDADGNVVLKDPGRVVFAFDIDDNGTPGDPDDDVDVPGSFHVVRPSTGNSDLSGRDFCADLVTFTS